MDFLANPIFALLLRNDWENYQISIGLKGKSQTKSFCSFLQENSRHLFTSKLKSVNYKLLMASNQYQQYLQIVYCVQVLCVLESR